MKSRNVNPADDQIKFIVRTGIDENSKPFMDSHTELNGNIVGNITRRYYEFTEQKFLETMPDSSLELAFHALLKEVNRRDIDVSD